MKYRIVHYAYILRDNIVGRIYAEDRFAIEVKRFNLFWVPYSINGTHITFKTKDEAQDFINVLQKEGTIA